MMGNSTSSSAEHSSMAGRDNEAMDESAGPDDSTDVLSHVARLYTLLQSGQVRLIGNDSIEQPDYADLVTTPDVSKAHLADLTNRTVLSQTKAREHINRKWNRNTAGFVCAREHGPSFSRSNRHQLYAKYLPNRMQKLAKLRAKVFVSQFNTQGDLFVCASQDHTIRVFDTSYGRAFPKSIIEARDVGWSVLDVVMSPDSRHIAYSSWSDYIHQCSVNGEEDSHTAFNLCPGENRFCIFSLKFSPDGDELLAGASDRCLYVYNRATQTRALRIEAHEDDVNTVAFGDAQNGQIFYTGGDDGLCKVWDRRTLSESSPQPVGILAGHTDGITFIDSRGDSRYLISNSKDQTIKLWDIRRFSTPDGQAETRRAVARQQWDYRWQAVPSKALKNRRRLQGDTSIVTYRGHVVLHTLIRSYFSPAHTTGQRYIYTGSATGQILIYDVLTGEIVRKLTGHDACVRDVSWHPYETLMASSSWDGNINAWVYSTDDSTRRRRYRSESMSSDVADEDEEDSNLTTDGVDITYESRRRRMMRRAQQQRGVQTRAARRRLEMEQERSSSEEGLEL